MPTDATLIQIVDAAFAEAGRRSAGWLLCRSGCTQCCMGEFPITPLDAVRLRQGFKEMAATDPVRAARIRERVHLTAANPAGRSDNDPCPVLDPETGACDLYNARPLTCRTAGPPVACADGSIAVCELCYEGASDDQIAACAVEFDPEGIEATLIEDLARAGLSEETTITQALLM